MNISFPPPCRLVVSDLESAFHRLEQLHSSSRIEEEEEEEEALSPIKTQSTIIFDLVVLSQLASTCKAVIEVSGECLV